MWAEEISGEHWHLGKLVLLNEASVGNGFGGILVNENHYGMCL